MYRLAMISFAPYMPELPDAVAMEDFLWTISEQANEAFGLDVVSITDHWGQDDGYSWREWLVSGIIQAPDGGHDPILTDLMEFCIDGFDALFEVDCVGLVSIELPFFDESTISRFEDIYGDRIRYIITSANLVYETYNKEPNVN